MAVNSDVSYVNVLLILGLVSSAVFAFDLVNSRVLRAVMTVNLDVGL